MRNKNRRIYIWVTEEEKRYWRDKADKAKMDLGEYMLKAADNTSIYIVEGIPEMSLQLRKIGTNLNQLAHLSNAGRIKCLDLEPLKDEVKKVLQSLNLLIVKTRKLKA